MPPWLKACLAGARFCGESIKTFVLWCLWLILSLAVVGQVYLARVREIEPPAFLQRQLDRQLAQLHLRASYERARIDVSGRIVLHALSLSPASLADPLVTADTVILDLDPWALLAGRAVVDRLQLEGAALRLPTRLAPSGHNEAIIEDLALDLSPEGPLLTIDSGHARLGPLAFTFHGAIQPPASTPPSALSLDARIQLALDRYFAIALRLAETESHLTEVTGLSLDIALTPSPTTIAVARFELRAESVEATGPAFNLPTLDRLRLNGIVAGATLPLSYAPLQCVTATFSVDHVDAAPFIVTENCRGRVSGSFDTTEPHFAPEKLHLQAGPTLIRGISAGAPVLTVDVDLAQPGNQTLAVLTRLAGAPWSTTFQGDLRVGAGALTASGVVTPAGLSLVGQTLGRDLSPLLQFKQGPSVEGRVAFDAGWKLHSVRGRAEIGPVVARNVSLDRASSEFVLAGTTLRCDDIVLATGPSLARGRYEMDTATLDYRFLLSGQLQPAAIEGWFRDWWPRFWSEFAFTTPPVADVEVAGRWGDTGQSAVFVVAEAENAALRGARFDTVHTRIFVRPHWCDVIAFAGAQDQLTARGEFTRTFDLNTKTWQEIDFDVVSDLPLSTASHLLGSSGESWLAPYRFSNPPHVEVHGHLSGPADPAGQHASIDLQTTAAGPFTFFGFPLNDLHTSVEIRDDLIRLPDLTFGFAQGNVSGTAELSGVQSARKLAFDAKLEGAVLGQAIRILEEFKAPNRSSAARSAPVSRFQKQLAAGRLDVSLAAKGPINSLFELQGEGKAMLSGAELGQINLLGLLSELMQGAGLGFTSLKLDSARTRFLLQGDHLAFPELLITGPNATIESSGRYALKTKMLDLKAKVQPFDGSQSLLGNTMDFVLTPFSAALEVKLEGSLEKPKWIFLYGPTRFLRKLGGKNDP